MKRTCDLFIEENVSHRLQNARVECQRKFSDVTSAGVRVENVVQLLRLVTRCIDNLSAAKVEPDSVKTRALINSGGVETDMSLHRVSHRTSENLAIGNIAVAAANNRGNSLDAKAQVGFGSFDLHAIGSFEQRLQRFHTGLKPPIIQRADVEIKILERFGAHSGQLRH